jgi:hypothetical protein
LLLLYIKAEATSSKKITPHHHFFLAVGCPAWTPHGLPDLRGNNRCRHVRPISHCVRLCLVRLHVMLLEPSPIAQSSHRSQVSRLTLPISLSLSPLGERPPSAVADTTPSIQRFLDWIWMCALCYNCALPSPQTLARLRPGSATSSPSSCATSTPQASTAGHA